MTAPAVSIVISCFNYERFVGEAIESALAQRDADTEVIVVDDGSTDGSRVVIGAFGDRVAALGKQNGGQASALNVGFAASRGDAVIFLDADDLLLESAAAAVAQTLADRAIAKAHWSMPIVDARTQATGQVQDPELAEGDLRQAVLRDGPLSEMTMPNPPMSGNGFARWYLERVMPIPEDPYRTAADEYLFGLAPVFGEIARLEPQSLYRVHGRNDHRQWSFERMLAFQLQHHELIADVAADALRRDGLTPDLENWSRASWWLRASRVVSAIERTVPVGGRFALIDEGAFGIESELRGRTAVPFPEHDGEFAGSPADDAQALRELRALDGTTAHLVLAWPAFWWLDEYPALASELRSRYRTLLDDDDVIIFRSRGGRTRRAVRRGERSGSALRDDR